MRAFAFASAVNRDGRNFQTNGNVGVGAAGGQPRLDAEHGSGGNRTSDSWRRAYIVALRSEDTVRRERELGFTHSHNDAAEVLDRVDGLHAEP